MAEAILGDLIDDHPSLAGIVVKSAGTFACDGADMADFAEEALEELGIKHFKHRAKLIDQELLDEADLILTMQAQHLEEISALSPESEGKVHTLKGYVQGVEGFVEGEDYDIEDPYRQPFEVYLECATELKGNIVKLVSQLEGGAAKGQQP